MALKEGNSGAREPARTRGLDVFRNRNFRLLWFGAVASNVGTWIQQVAQGWLVITLTNSPGWLGAVALATSLPFLVVPLFGGVIADRVDRVKLLQITQTTSMVLAFTLAALTIVGVVEVWQIIVLAFLNSTSNSFDQPTRNALLPDMVREEELMQAVSLQSTAFQGAALVGPAIAGVLVGVIGVGGCFLINGVSFLFVIFALTLMKVPQTKPAVLKPVVSDMLEGLSFLRRSSLLIAVLVLTSIFSIFGRSYSTLMPAIAKIELDLNSEALGLMYAMPGLGTLVGGFALAASGDIRRKGTLLTVTAVFTGAVLLALSLSTSLIVLLVMLVGVGVTTTVFNATASTVLQINSPGNMRGRVMSFNTIAWRGFTPLGGALAGVLAQFFGTRFAIGSGGLVVLVAAIGLFVVLPYIRQADREADSVPASARTSA
ncbi:MAG: MFS transporter [Dehalococcoidia bacterium]